MNARTLRPEIGETYSSSWGWRHNSAFSTCHIEAGFCHTHFWGQNCALWHICLLWVNQHQGGPEACPGPSYGFITFTEY